MTKIEWADETWNPTVGCSRVSPGCDNCYAIGVAHRAMQPAHEGLTIKRPGERPDWTGEVRELPDRLATPLGWRKPRLVFVDSMSDLFHPDISLRFTAQVFAVMGAAHRHTFQVLTKRPARMAAILSHDLWPEKVNLAAARLGLPEPDWCRVEFPAPGLDHDAHWLPNVWLGTSIENDRYTFRASHLRATPAAVRFLSLEPLLGPLPSLDLAGIGWVIVGGESGSGARPMHPDWVRDLRDRCVAAGVPFFFKQWGAWVQSDREPGLSPASRARFRLVHARPNRSDRALYMEDVGKRAAGRVLDGRTWDGMPAQGAA